MKKLFLTTFLTLMLVISAFSQTNYYVSTTGTNTNSGSSSSPWSLKHASSGANGTITCGDTVNIIGGTYGGRFVFNLNGCANNPITVKPYNNERVIIDGGIFSSTLLQDTGTSPAYEFDNISISNVDNFSSGQVLTIGNEQMQFAGTNSDGTALVVRGWSGTCPSGTCGNVTAGVTVKTFSTIVKVFGSYTNYIGLEVTNTGHVTRVESQGIVDGGIGIDDSCTVGCKFINNVVNNAGGGGFGSFNNANGSEFYGNISYLNGFEQPNGEGVGHGFYIQNSSSSAPVKLIKDNMAFFNFNFNSQAYTDSGHIDNLTYEGNTMYLAGITTTVGPTYNFLIGGGNQAFIGFKMLSNYTYGNTIGVDRRGTDIVGWAGTPCTSPEIRDNYLASGYFELGANCTTQTVTNNIFYTTVIGGTFPNNIYYSTRPTVNSIFVRPNLYQTGRGTITVYNWNNLDSVSVNISSLGLVNGQAYVVKDAQNFTGANVASGIYQGSPISIPMTSTAVAPVYGTVNVQPYHTAKEFGNFVVLPLGVPTASNVTITGAISRANGGVVPAGTIVRFTNASTGQQYTSTLSPFKFYSVTVPIDTYIVTITGKGISFNPVTMTVMDNMDGVNFVIN